MTNETARIDPYTVCRCDHRYMDHNLSDACCASLTADPLDERMCGCEAFTPKGAADFKAEHDGKPAAYGTYRETRVFFGGCPDGCGGTESIDGEWATGETLLSAYRPTVGELVQNHARKCGRCGRLEVS